VNTNVKVSRRGLRFVVLLNHEQVIGVAWTRRGALRNADTLACISERFFNIRSLGTQVGDQ